MTKLAIKIMTIILTSILLLSSLLNANPGVASDEGTDGGWLSDIEIESRQL